MDECGLVWLSSVWFSGVEFDLVIGTAQAQLSSLVYELVNVYSRSDVYLIAGLRCDGGGNNFVSLYSILHSGGTNRTGHTSI